MHHLSRRLFPALLALCCLLSLPLPSRAGEPALTIVMTGNTYGNFAPCPS